MTTHKSKISLKFVFIISLLLGAVVVFIYLQEKRKFANAETVSAIVVGSRIVPRKCLIEAKVESGRYKANILSVTVPFWDSKTVGERIRIRVDKNDSSIIEVDKPLYLHKVSLGILTGTMALGIFLIAGFACKKRCSCAEN